MNHEAYVFAAYAVSAVALVAMGAWILIDQAARRRELTELEARGVRRRSEKGGKA